MRRFSKLLWTFVPFQLSSVCSRVAGVCCVCFFSSQKSPGKNVSGVVICLERDADLHMAQLMPLPLTVSCISKIQTGFTFLVPAHLGSPGQRAVKRMCVLLLLLLLFLIPQVVKIPGVKNYKSKNQNVGWSEVRQVNWQSVVQKHRVEAL